MTITVGMCFEYMCLLFDYFFFISLKERNLKKKDPIMSILSGWKW